MAGGGSSDALHSLRSASCGSFVFLWVVDVFGCLFFFLVLVSVFFFEVFQPAAREILGGLSQRSGVCVCED